jgi:hypothetical protein
VIPVPVLDGTYTLPDDVTAEEWVRSWPIVCAVLAALNGRIEVVTVLEES